ncbi:MAG TPA: hypothetical protein VHE35_23800, partial [Kofleriaceae bacterium]|nr:hypothetical protein [Kofleriaceae bacterium]
MRARVAAVVAAAFGLCALAAARAGSADDDGRDLDRVRREAAAMAPTELERRLGAPDRATRLAAIAGA